MKLGIIYFEETQPDDRKHHEVNKFLLAGWINCYRQSKSSLEVYMLTDEKTKIPSCWPYKVCRVEDSDPPKRKDVLQKVGWIKSQAYEYLGKCVVMDIDALLIGKIDPIKDLQCEIAMAPDSGSNKLWSEDWPEVGHKHNAGVLILNSSKILETFREIWNDKEEFMNTTYYDELIFSTMLHSMDGHMLDKKYNFVWEQGSNLENVSVVHFPGNRKKDLIRFIKSRII